MRVVEQIREHSAIEEFLALKTSFEVTKSSVYWVAVRKVLRRGGRHNVSKLFWWQSSLTACAKSVRFMSVENGHSAATHLDKLVIVDICILQGKQSQLVSQTVENFMWTWDRSICVSAEDAGSTMSSTQHPTSNWAGANCSIQVQTWNNWIGGKRGKDKAGHSTDPRRHVKDQSMSWTAWN